MYDPSLALRAASAGNLTQTETGSYVDYGGPDLVPQVYVVHVPSAGGTSPTLDVKINESSDGSNPIGDAVVLKQITAAGDYFITWKSNQRYRNMVATVGGTSPNFGAVVIAPVTAGRDVNW